MLAKMIRRAEEYMPALGTMSAVRVWTGFRAATPDKLPLIGPCPGYRSLWLATGHEGLGITTSLVTGQSNTGSYRLVDGATMETTAPDGVVRWRRQ